MTTQLARDMIATMYPQDIRNALIAAGMRGDFSLFQAASNTEAEPARPAERKR